MTQNIFRTVYGAELQTRQLLKLPFSMRANTTLNEKLNIASGVAPDSGQMPAFAYWCIGNGAHKFSSGQGGLTKTEKIPHLGTDGGLYNQVPFAIKPLASDFATQDRNKYMLRKQITLNSSPYIAYYGKRIDFTGVTAGLQKLVTVDGVTTATTFTPDSTNLNPTPPVLDSEGINTISGQYVSASATLNLSLSADDVTELMNVFNLLYGDTAYAVISEMGLLTGVDKTILSPTQGGTINFNDAIAVQVWTYVLTNVPLEFSPSGWNILLDIGATEPLLSISPS